MVVRKSMGVEDFEKVLRRYNIGKYKAHRCLEEVLENSVYILKTTKGKFIFKILENVNLENYQNQLDLIDYLYDKKILVVKNIKNRNGKEIFIYGKKKIIIQIFIEGIHPKRMPDSLVRDIAKNVGKMHMVLLNSKFKLKRKTVHIYRRRKIGECKNKDLLNELLSSLISDLKKFEGGKMKVARIHGDLSEINMIVRKNKLRAFIDFDDSDYDYLVYDLAIFIAHAFVRSDVIYKDKIKLFLRDYYKVIDLNGDEKRFLYYLIKYRLFGIFYWHFKYMKLYPNKKKSLIRGMNRSIDRLFNFEKVSLNKFLGWVK